MTFVNNLWVLMLELAPWLFAGTVIASLLHVWLPKDFISRRLGGGGLGEVTRAVALGVPLPLCSCGVIPAAITLKKDGGSDGAAVGFLISTPQTGVDSILVTASMLGWPFAIFKVFAALITGVIGGFITERVKPDPADAPQPAIDLHDHHSEAKGWREALRYGYAELLYPIWRWLLIGMLISAAMTTVVPHGEFATLIEGGVWTLLLMVAISVPLYVCAIASVPVAASLVASGFPEGAALVFLMAGPATNVATIGATYRVFGTRVMIIYLLTVLLGSVGFGLAFDVFWGLETTAPMSSHPHDSLLASGSAILLIGLLGWFAFQDLRQAFRPKGPKEGQETIEMTVSGLTCGGCVKTLTSGLQAVSGVEKVDVVLDTGHTQIHGHALNRDALEHVIRKVGFSV